MDRGPKPKTAKNSRRKTGPIHRDTLEPPYPLAGEVLAEYRRLVGVLVGRGTVDRVDVSVIAECARVHGLLLRAHADVGLGTLDLVDIKMVNLLTSQRRGLLRELGLTLQPSRTLIKTTAAPSDAPQDLIAAKIKIHKA